MVRNRKNRDNLRTEEFRIDGMECKSCERIIEREAKKVGGVVDIKADYVNGTGKLIYDADKTSQREVFNKINEKGYVCGFIGEAPAKKGGARYVTLLLGLVVLLAGAYFFLEGLNFSIPTLDQNTSLLLLFTIGLLTGFHCIAMCGGFVVSYTSKDAVNGNAGINLKSHIAYGFGKTLSYTLIGAAFGFIGSFLTFTPLLRGIAAVLAGLFLILFGLNMLDILLWFRRFRLSTPNFIEKITYRWTGGNSSPLAIGLMNGLMIACGPLQAVYIFAAASGSTYYGALYLLVFGLGTLPVLLGFGVITSIISAQLTRRILRFSGVVVVLLGLIMLNRGLALTGRGYDLNTVVASASALRESNASKGVSENTVKINEQGFQEIRMEVNKYGWSPDKFVLKKGVPVKWIIDGKEITSCNNAIQVPKLGLKFSIKPGLQTIEFTPNDEGVIPWSCWMGMIPGRFIVKSGIDIENKEEVKTALDAVTVPSGGGCGGGGGGCGCGGFKL